MACRMTGTTISFSRSFEIRDVEGIHPAGEYRVETEDEDIEGLSRAASRRVALYLRLPSLSSPQHFSELVPIQQADLDEALRKDRAETG